jgi:hypothetical protein
MLWNQVLPVLGAGVPVEHFSWDHKHPDGRKGREVVLDLKRTIEHRAPAQADNVLMVLRQVLTMPLIKGGCPVIRTQHWEPRAPSRGTSPHPTQHCAGSSCRSSSRSWSRTMPMGHW